MPSRLAVEPAATAIRLKGKRARSRSRKAIADRTRGSRKSEEGLQALRAEMRLIIDRMCHQEDRGRPHDIVVVRELDGSRSYPRRVAVGGRWWPSGFDELWGHWTLAAERPPSGQKTNEQTIGKSVTEHEARDSWSTGCTDLFGVAFGLFQCLYWPSASASRPWVWGGTNCTF